MAREKQLATQAQRPLATLEPWDTFREMERMFRDFFTAPLPWWRGQRWLSDLRTEFSPEVDLRETKKELVLSTTVPGINKEDIDINVTSDRITISGERKHEEEKPDEKLHIRQQSYGSFQVSYSLPTEVKPKEVRASYRDGVLEVKMPKAAQAEVVQKVKIET